MLFYFDPQNNLPKLGRALWDTLYMQCVSWWAGCVLVALIDDSEHQVSQVVELSALPSPCLRLVQST